MTKTPKPLPPRNASGQFTKPAALPSMAPSNAGAAAAPQALPPAPAAMPNALPTLPASTPAPLPATPVPQPAPAATGTRPDAPLPLPGPSATEAPRTPGASAAMPAMMSSGPVRVAEPRSAEGRSKPAPHPFTEGSGGGSGEGGAEGFRLASLGTVLHDLVTELRNLRGELQRGKGLSSGETPRKPGPQADGSFVPGGAGPLGTGGSSPRPRVTNSYPRSRDQIGASEWQQVMAGYRR